MKRPTYTPAEYRQLGHQLTWMKEQRCTVNSLLSKAYPPQHALVQSAVTATRTGLTDFKFHLHNMGRHEHPHVDMEEFFHPVGHENYQPPDNLPGCSMFETCRVEASLRRRRVEKKREPLTLNELEIVTQCFFTVIDSCRTIIDRFIKAYDPETLPGPVTDLILASWHVFDAYYVALQEKERVAHEQA